MASGAAAEMEAAVEDLEIEDGRVIVRGVPDKGVTLASIGKKGNLYMSKTPPVLGVSRPAFSQQAPGFAGQLARIEPTKVAIESSRVSSTWNDRYAAWRKARGALGANEIEQVGFRLADAAGLAALSPVDYPMWMDGTTAAERHDPKPAPVAVAAPEAEPELTRAVKRQLAVDDARLAAGTISEYLAYLNSPGRAVRIRHE